MRNFIFSDINIWYFILRLALLLVAIINGQKIAIQNQNMQIEEEHLLASLINQENGFIPELLKKININVDNIKVEIDKSIKLLPVVTGTGREPDKIYVSNDVDKVFIHIIVKLKLELESVYEPFKKQLITFFKDKNISIKSDVLSNEMFNELYINNFLIVL